MKTICFALISFLSMFTGTMPNQSVDRIDLRRFGGTWYSLSSIPTMFDKGSRETTTHYALNKDGYYNVVTTCKKEDNSIRSVTSKIFPEAGSRAGEMKAQFIWPIKVDYWVVDLAPDYSWAVVGHPDYRWLFIMSRKPQMDKKQYEEIVAHCKEMGYPVDQLVLQQFPHELE